MVDAFVFIVPPLPVVIIPLFEPRVNELVVCNVPLFNVILSLSTDPGVIPRLDELEIEIVPPSIIVLPV